jgi:RimJ/RimL family protein N-acetyltransferase
VSAAAEYPKTVVLTDGAHLELRPLAPDANGCPAGVTPTAGALLAVVAWDGERAGGLVELLRRPDVDATAEVRIALAAGYRGRRLGTWLLLDAVHAAEALGIERLVATPDSGDAEYLAALRRLHFVEEGAGSRLLVRTLHRGWPRF